MAQHDVEILRGAFEAASEGDAGALLRVSDPEVRVYPRPEEPGVREVYEGWDGAMEYAVNWFGQWEAYEFEPVRILDAGEQILIVLRERGRMEASGIEVEAEFSHSFRMRDGLIVEWRMYDSYEEAAEAVGLTD